MGTRYTWAGIPGPPDPGCVTSASHLTSLSFAVPPAWVNGGLPAPFLGTLRGIQGIRAREPCEEPAGAVIVPGAAGSCGPHSPLRVVRVPQSLRAAGRQRQPGWGAGTSAGTGGHSGSPRRPPERPAGGRLSPRAGRVLMSPRRQPRLLKGPGAQFCAEGPLHQRRQAW